MKLQITRPDDWHLHLRDGKALESVVQHTAAQFARAIVMPNLATPVTTTTLAREYRQRILKALPEDSTFEPLMTLYLTENTRVSDIQEALQSGFIKACKLYPAGATTNSDAGVRDIKKLYPILSAMQEHGLVLCLHGEVVTQEVDIFDREKVYVDQTLAPLVQDFPGLRIVLEHITTAAAAQFVEAAADNLAATITPQHLLYNRNHLLVGGIRPHFYCLPILKRDSDRKELNRVATSGNPKFFLGTDSAPHANANKETACGCAGMYSAHAAIELYTEAFEANDSLDKLEGFASHFGADFYHLPRNKQKITLIKAPWQVPKSYHFGNQTLTPMRANESITWTLESVNS